MTVLYTGKSASLGGKLSSRLKLGLTIAVVGAVLLGCQAKTDLGGPTSGSASDATQAGKTVSAQLVGYNHTDKTIAAFYVNGVWGSNAFPHSGGGGFVCCVDLPDPWPEGYKVTITWEDHEGKTQKREVPVPKYDSQSIAGFKVHFLRSGQIKVFANRVMLGHPDYPLKGAEAELKPSVPTAMVN